jgi:hypothetical protein
MLRLMTNTPEHTAKCLKCGRIRHFRSAAAALSAGPHGRICAMRVRIAAITEAVRGFATAQVEKARELISDGGIIPTKRPGVFRAVSSKGDETYLVHSAVCNCPAGLRSVRCYHRAAAAVLLAAGKAA